MAIENMQGKISTTGMVNSKPAKIEVPDMSKIKMPTNKKVSTPKEVVQKPAPQEAPKQEGLLEKVQNLTNEDKAVLSTVLSPSVSTVLSKVAPEIEPLLKQFTKDEENVVLPVSIVKNFASRKYPGTEQESIQSFVSDLAGQMEQETTVPPDTQMAEQAESGMEQEFNTIDGEDQVV